MSHLLQIYNFLTRKTNYLIAKWLISIEKRKIHSFFIFEWIFNYFLLTFAIPICDSTQLLLADKTTQIEGRKEGVAYEK